MEGTQQGRWLIRERPKAKIAVLYQNDDLGKDFVRGIKIGLGEQGAKAVVAEATYEVGDPRSILKLSRSTRRVPMSWSWLARQDLAPRPFARCMT